MQKKKSPRLAAFLSFCVTGLGQIYVGHLYRGLLLLFLAVIGSFLFVIPGLVVFIFNIIDAYQLAKKHNDEIPTIE